MLGLTPYLTRKPHALSGGQRQRVALGRAIVREPRVFLFDEPLSNLDAALRVSTRNELIKLHQRLRATIVYVTHDQVEAMTMGTRICIMNRGRVAQIGAPLDVYRAPADTFVAGFLGNPPMNLLPATMKVEAGHPQVVLAGRRLQVPGAALGCLARYDGGPIIFGVRPEDLRIHADATDAAFAGTVSAVEPLGAETLVNLRLDGTEQDIVLRGGRDCSARMGDRLHVTFDVATVHYFDPKTTAAITEARGA